MSDHLSGKSIAVTGAGGGFGRLVAQKAAARGACITCGDVDEAANAETVELVRAAGGTAQAVRADVTSRADMVAMVAAASDAYGVLDVMINNAGIMPLAFFADHEAAHDAWDRCIDINFKGVLNGMVAAYDAMMAQGRGHIVNLSSIYGNHPVVGGGVYGATKSAVVFLSEAMRVEARGKIKVTVIKPTGVPTTGLSATIVNNEAGMGCVGQNMGEFMDMVARVNEGTYPPEKLDAENIDYALLAPEHIANAIIHVIDQPWGVAISEMTVRAAGDHFVI
ncbi:MAG: SDR family NAD(P)-dependent oxidoreductase [Sphingomonadaceae bacterium]